jgi:hypothetical protein
VKGWQHRRGL